MANLRTLTGFKSSLAGGGARPNLFEVSIPTLPPAATSAGATWDATTFQFLCTAAALPASTVSPIDVPFRGRILKVAGDRIVDPWTITVINDEDFKIRTALEFWMNGISKLDNNTGATSPASYMTNAEVFQLGRGAERGRNSTSNNGGTSAGSAAVNPLRSYKFYDIFPTAIQDIPLSYDSGDQIEYFTVDFAVQYWTAGETTDQVGARMT
jgi:hypothetical protein